MNNDDDLQIKNISEEVENTSVKVEEFFLEIFRLDINGAFKNGLVTIIMHYNESIWDFLFFKCQILLNKFMYIKFVDVQGQKIKKSYVINFFLN